VVSPGNNLGHGLITKGNRESLHFKPSAFFAKTTAYDWKQGARDKSREAWLQRGNMPKMN
jgi:hypothetical protein